MKKEGFLSKRLLFFVVMVFFVSFKLFAEQKEDKKDQPKVVPKRLMLKGSIKGPDDWQQVPQFRVFFNGRSIISDEEGFYSFPLDAQTNHAKLLICKDIDQNFDNVNTIESLHLKIEKPYHYFSLKLTGTDYNIWQQKEKSLEKKNFIIPQNCVIVLINPKYVEKVKKWEVRLEDNFIKLPQIVLKESFDEKRVKREAAKSLLRTLDANLFHQNEEVAQKSEKMNIKISIVR